MIADLLFVFQLICVLIFGGNQVIQMLSTTQGVSAIWILSSEVFFGLNFWLVWQAHRTKPTRVTAQTKFIYAALLAFGLLEFSVLLYQDGPIWNQFDTIATAIIATGSLITLAIARHKKLSLLSPAIKAAVAILAIGIPQLMMAFNIYTYGGDGLAIATIITGHISVGTRFGQLLFSLRTSRDAHRLSAIASESANWASWIVVTACWINR